MAPTYGSLRLQALTALLTVVLPTGANAIADVRGGAQGGPGAPAAVVITGPLEATLSASHLGATAFGYANTVQGVLRSSAVASYVPGTPYASDITSTILESVTFLNGFGTTAYLDYIFTGSISLAGNPEPFATFGQMAVFANSTIVYTTLAPPNTACGAGCVFGTSIARTGSLAFTVGAAPMNLGASVQAYAQYGNSANFENTGRLYLRTEQGVNFSSATGLFLTQATPILPIPEPATYTMLLIGIGLISIYRRSSK